MGVAPKQKSKRQQDQAKRIEGLKALKEKAERLRDWRIDDELPPSDELIDGIMAIAERAATQHMAYHHYTSFEGFKHIAKSRQLRLTRLSSTSLNDRNERDKYAKSSSVANRTFITCFNHEGAECANLWWLYSKGEPKSLRLTIPHEAFQRWAEELRAREPKTEVRDVVYAAVKGWRDEYQYERQDVLSWDDQRVHIPNLSEYLGNERFCGCLKDYEWRAEHETRIIVRGKGVSRFEYIDIPDYVWDSLKITTSPWVTDDDYEEIMKTAQELLAGKWKMTRQNFRPSVLERTMDALSTKMISLNMLGACRCKNNNNRDKRERKYDEK